MTFAFPKPSFRRLKPKRGKRGEFSRLTRELIYERDEGLCRQCGAPAQEIHHVRFRSQNGRGVVSNGICVCHRCHRMIHNNPRIASAWQHTFEERYGLGYWKDQYDE